MLQHNNDDNDIVPLLYIIIVSYILLSLYFIIYFHLAPLTFSTFSMCLPYRYIYLYCYLVPPPPSLAESIYYPGHVHRGNLSKVEGIPMGVHEGIKYPPTNSRPRGRLSAINIWNGRGIPD